MLSTDEDSFSIIKNNILYYICGLIIRSILNKLDCSNCINCLLYILLENNYCHAFLYFALVNVKNTGGLVKSSFKLTQIIKFLEIFLYNYHQILIIEILKF